MGTGEFGVGSLLVTASAGWVEATGSSAAEFFGTSASAALSDSLFGGPAGLAFGGSFLAGYGVGTWIYNDFDESGYNIGAGVYNLFNPGAPGFQQTIAHPQGH